ncbi:DUF167 domain-containing protein [Geotalea uraniireducens]|uniref:UPF0235 protein Gura_1167 n=1 Tax=Geotalea uraniireducens (strain Rf4) TaxID=351605 RepID=A5GAM3_GEOUR|nr:DUF167 domain-containing protein [Geotalea uraniireducens]ABQ25371.1 protein of unknown function DUF167 [Geotalea uraniireducens Rf4]
MKNESDTGGLKITETADGVIFTVHVQPRASRNEICGVQGDELKLRLTAPPVEDAANKLCVELLAKALKVAKSRVTITAGAKSRHKTVKVEGITTEPVLSLLK